MSLRETVNVVLLYHQFGSVCIEERVWRWQHRKTVEVFGLGVFTLRRFADGWRATEWRRPHERLHR